MAEIENVLSAVPCARTKYSGAEKQRRYRERHKDDPEYRARVRSQNRLWAANNKEWKSEYGKKYRRANTTRIAANNKRWRDENHLELFSKKRRYYEENREADHVRCAAWRAANLEHHRLTAKRWAETNKARRVANMARWREENPHYAALRYAKDLTFKIKALLRSRVLRAIKADGAKKEASALNLIGCTVEELKRHLEQQFLDGMTWENMGAWHIDHVRPLASFDLTDPDQQKIACHFTNLQPLWAKDNMRKGAKLNWSPEK